MSNRQTRTRHDGRGRAVVRALLATLLAASLAGCASTPKGSAKAPEKTYSFWPPMPDQPRVQFLRSFRFSSDVEPPQSGLDKLIFGSETRVLPISKPYGVAYWDGRIYVCDLTNPGVVILDLRQQQTRLMVARGVEQMTQPTDIAIAPDGMKYVIDRRSGRIFAFGADDRHVATFGSRDLVLAGVAVHGEELYVLDFASESILVLDRHDGTTLRSISAPDTGGESDPFVRPVGIHVDGQGDIYVTDAIRGRLQKLDPEGELMLTIGQLVDAPGNFVRPKHVTVDDEGIIYVVDAAFQNVQMFNADGQLLLFFGGPGPHPGSMSLPAGIAVSSEGLDLFADEVHPAFEADRLVFVTNQFGLNKVSVYAVGHLKEGRTLADIAPYAAEVIQPVESEPSPVQETGGEE